MAEEPAESGDEEGGSGRGGAPSMWWLIIAVAALIALAVVAIAIPVFMKRSGGGSTNGLTSGNSSAGNSGTGEDHIDMDEFDGDDQNSALQKGMYSGQHVVVIPKDCGTTMTVKMRRSFLLSHNRHRSRAAKGMFTVKNPGSMLHVLPTAARMPALKYNCSLEQLSMKWAHQVQCQMVHSDYDLGENLFAMTGTGEMEHLEEAAETATNVWVEEIDKFGISASLTYESQIGHATQVLWGGTETLGCGVLPCKNGWIMAICEYYPRGNVIGYPMYKAGKTLSECGLGGRREIAHSKTGLCLIS